MIDLSRGLSLLKTLSMGSRSELDESALAHYLSNFALHFAPDDEIPELVAPNQPDFWLFLPFSSAPDFPQCTPEKIRQLALASTCMIIYNILFDSVVDEPGKPDVTIQVLAEYALASMHKYLYTLFPIGSPFWDHYGLMYERFLGSLVEEQTGHKRKPQPYSYEDYVRISKEKMSMVMLNPIGLAILGNVPERIPKLIDAWDEMNVAVVILDDIKDWEEDYEEQNYTYLLTSSLEFDQLEYQSLPENEDELLTKMIFSGGMEDLYGRGAIHLDNAAQLAEEAISPALAELARERAAMFRRFGWHLTRRKLIGLREHLATARPIL